MSPLARAGAASPHRLKIQAPSWRASPTVPLRASGVWSPGYSYPIGRNRGTPHHNGKGVLNVSKADDVSTTDDDEKYKALIRELHEATKDAKLAKRELQAERERLSKDLARARKMVGNDFKELATRVVGEYMNGLNNSLTAHAGVIGTMVKEADEAVRRCAADLASMKDPDEFIAEVVSRLSGDITDTLDRKFLDLAEQFFRGTAEAKQHRRQKREPHPPAIFSSPFRPVIQLPNGGSGQGNEHNHGRL